MNKSIPFALKHGMRKSPEYNVWANMKYRCQNERNPAYHNYGGRGICVCERWLCDDGFANFLADLGCRPTEKHSLDRINNDGNYEPGNVRWATKAVQEHNKRLSGRNKTRICGVYRSARDGLYVATTKFDGQKLYLGSSTDFFEACCLRKSFESRHPQVFGAGQ